MKNNTLLLSLYEKFAVIMIVIIINTNGMHRDEDCQVSVCEGLWRKQEWPEAIC